MNMNGILVRNGLGDVWERVVIGRGLGGTSEGQSSSAASCRCFPLANTLLFDTQPNRNHTDCNQQETEAQAIRKECLSLPRTFRETDLFKLHQTIDLNNLDPSSSQAERLKALLKLKSDLYSPEFRLYLEQVGREGQAIRGVRALFRFFSCLGNRMWELDVKGRLLI
eukprot:475691-Amorphochlora_amoeboformis.AAC.2